MRHYISPLRWIGTTPCITRDPMPTIGVFLTATQGKTLSQL
jgi:hypothetical protein